ncbi:MAG: hypothetical protein R2681_00280 [Pyrinomonadaceae bacterium]
MRKKNIWISLGITFSVLFNTLPLPAQKRTAAKVQQAEIDLATGREMSDVYRSFLKESRDKVFSNLVKETAGKSYTENLENDLEDRSVEFLTAINAASENSLKEVAQKASLIRQKRYEELKNAKPGLNPDQAKQGIRRGGPFSDVGESFPDLFENGFESENKIQDFETYSKPVALAIDDAVISRTETETGIRISGNASETKELAEATVTRSESADNKVDFDGKGMTVERSRTEKTEVTSHSDGRKVSKTTKLVWGASFNVCPDKDGRVPGKLKAAVTTQTSINFGKEIAALTDELAVEFRITGFVNDDAVMTHFDMEGETSHTKTGYDRAKQRKLIPLEEGIGDGITKGIYQNTGNKPPYSVDGDYGMKKTVEIKFSDSMTIAHAGLSPAQIAQLSKITGLGIQMGMFELSDLMRSSIYKWQNYECVDVECTADKNTLAAGENIKVNAVSVSKQDLSKLNARLEGNGSEAVSPSGQFGTPTAVYNLTASKDGTAVITVKSTSRRGIGLGMLEFGKSWLDDKEVCDGNWQGTIEIRRSFEEEFKKTTSPGEISASPRMSGYQETINRFRYEGTVKTSGIKVSTANVSIMNATFSASAERYNLNQGYLLDPGECGWNKPTTARDESGTEVKENGTGEGITDITIQTDGTTYRVNLDIPKINGNYTRRNWRNASGYCQPKNNIPSDRTENNTTYFDRVGIAFDGVIDPKQPDVLNGSKTLISEDGKTKTIITWRLKRCFPKKANPKNERK